MVPVVAEIQVENRNVTRRYVPQRGQIDTLSLSVDPSIESSKQCLTKTEEALRWGDASDRLRV